MILTLLFAPLGVATVIQSLAHFFKKINKKKGAEAGGDIDASVRAAWRRYSNTGVSICTFVPVKREYTELCAFAFMGTLVA